MLSFPPKRSRVWSTDAWIPSTRHPAITVPRLLFGRPARRDRLLDAVAETVELRSPRPFGHFLDGEIFPPARKVEVSLGPRLTLVKA